LAIQSVGCRHTSKRRIVDLLNTREVSHAVGNLRDFPKTFWKISHDIRSRDVTDVTGFVEVADVEFVTVWRGVVMFKGAPKSS